MANWHATDPPAGAAPGRTLAVASPATGSALRPRPRGCDLAQQRVDRVRAYTEVRSVVRSRTRGGLDIGGVTRRCRSVAVCRCRIRGGSVNRRSVDEMAFIVLSSGHQEDTNASLLLREV
jgi:hypothetical protein